MPRFCLIGLWLLVPSLSLAQGLTPEEAASKMTVAEGLSVRLVASEPLVRQPVAIEFDDRGRLWVIQYLQYPNPEGLKRVEVDRYSRTKYDRRPEPPPRGPKGADRITILEDTDGDGRMDRGKDFVSGLNLATGLAFGNGGIYVINVPYLLFYHDKNRDDVPDGAPDVLLTGFGMEDAHSVANSLTWGPDGWLYGLQGSTVTANINGIEFQQGVWRYHPRTREFGLFAEGGGNMWGLDFDRAGNLFASTNVGGSVMLHFVQGGYYWKQFGKHGPLHNPYTFGYFDHVKHEGVKGGHVAVGGLFYFADAWPERYRGKYLAADLLDHSAHWHELAPRGSTFQARQMGDLLRANDPWFAPTDMTLGPDGSVYIADWHDHRTAHPDPDADWDRTNGRIYAIDGPGRRPIPRDLDISALSSAALLDMLDNPNVWYVRRARRVLSERRDPALAFDLVTRATKERGSRALEALWILHAYGDAILPVGEILPRIAGDLLGHPDAEVRAGMIRLIGDAPEAYRGSAARLRELAATDSSVLVRAQLAATARRLNGHDALAIAHELIRRDEDRDDPHIPLLLWWAVERHALAADAQARDRMIERGLWSSRLYREAIAPRLARRYVAEGTEAADSACAALLASAPDEEAGRSILAAIDEGLAGSRRPVAQELARPVLALATAEPADPVLVRLAVRLGDPAALPRALGLARDPERPEAIRLAMIAVLGEAADRSMIEPLIRLATRDNNTRIQAAALQALGRFEDRAIFDALLEVYPARDPAWRSEARSLFFRRRSWSEAFLDNGSRRNIDLKEVPLDQVALLARFGDPAIDRQVQQIWGRIGAATPEEKLAEVRRLNNDLRAAPGDPDRGRALFTKHCATCHKLNGTGNAVGPELTHANRQDRDFLLVSLVDPNGVVRKEFQATVVATRDGRVLTGLLAEQTPQQVTLIDARAERITLARSEIESMADSPASLMPEGLYRELSPQELRDLFAYLQR
jgi:putative membrane-bound dehydrogenase-like protein